MRDRRRRLLDFTCNRSLVSAQALETVLELAREDLPEHSSRRTQRRAKQDVAMQRTSHGALLRQVPTSTGSSLWFVHPWTMLELSARSSSSLAGLLNAAEQLSIIIYSDEVTPGNPLQVAAT